MFMNDCIFCKIVKGEIPSHQLYEDHDFLVFLDVFPAHRGHTLVIPKKHYENIFEMPEDIAEKVMGVGKKIVQAIEDALNADGYNFLQNNREQSGQKVMHYHLHIIPRYKKDGPKGAHHSVYPERYDYQADPKELANIAKLIKGKLKK